MSARLTFVAANGDVMIPGVDLKECNSSEHGAFMKLKAYEDTGYSPDEIDILLGKKDEPFSEDQKLRQQQTKDIARILAHPPYCTSEFCPPCAEDKCDPLGCEGAIKKWLNSTVKSNTAEQGGASSENKNKA